uniref:Uncharacterized protein n=1 Tax=Tetranychus urticae TaxID=32264 RepID=T1L1K3_TETUR
MLLDVGLMKLPSLLTAKYQMNFHTMITLSILDLILNFILVHQIWLIKIHLSILKKSRLVFMKISVCYHMLLEFNKQ